MAYTERHAFTFLLIFSYTNSTGQKPILKEEQVGDTRKEFNFLTSKHI